MTPERWQRINEMFHAALVLDGGQRGAFLVAQSAGDDALRAKVQALLTSHEQAEGFIQGSVFGDAAQLLVEEEAEAMIGQHIGLYKIDREIGRGGMGTVYLATRDDDQFEQQVAIKVVRRGMDTELFSLAFAMNVRYLPASIIQTLLGCSMAARPKPVCRTSSWNTSKARPSMSIATVTGSQPPLASNYSARFARRFSTHTKIS